ncbi:MAG: hypothetical protein V1857_06230 [archaeon]
MSEDSRDDRQLLLSVVREVADARGEIKFLIQSMNDVRVNVKTIADNCPREHAQIVEHSSQISALSEKVKTLSKNQNKQPSLGMSKKQFSIVTTIILIISEVAALLRGR